MSEPTQIGPGQPCSECGEDYGQHAENCPIGIKRKGYLGERVPKEYVAKALGFESAEAMDAWYADPANIERMKRSY